MTTLECWWPHQNVGDLCWIVVITYTPIRLCSKTYGPSDKYTVVAKIYGLWLKKYAHRRENTVQSGKYTVQSSFGNIWGRHCWRKKTGVFYDRMVLIFWKKIWNILKRHFRKKTNKVWPWSWWADRLIISHYDEFNAVLV